LPSGLFIHPPHHHRLDARQPFGDKARFHAQRPGEFKGRNHVDPDHGPRDHPHLAAEALLADALEDMPKDLKRRMLLTYLGFPFYDVATVPLSRREGLDEFNPVRIDRISPDDARSIREGGTAATLRSRPRVRPARCSRSSCPPPGPARQGAAAPRPDPPRGDLRLRNPPQLDLHVRRAYVHVSYVVRAREEVT
jgi:hypothetical protein